MTPTNGLASASAKANTRRRSNPIVTAGHSLSWQNPRALDWVWPQPATQAEIDHYYAEQAEKNR